MSGLGIFMSIVLLFLISSEKKQLLSTFHPNDLIEDFEKLQTAKTLSIINIVLNVFIFFIIIILFLIFGYMLLDGSIWKSTYNH